MKKCFKCGLEKSLDDFYAHKQMGDGHLNKCKDCTRSDTKKRADALMANPEFVESEKARHRDKYHRLGYRDIHKPTPEAKKRFMDSYRSAYPEKARAQSLSAKIKAPTGMEKHHWSYRKEDAKDVIFVTPKHHYLLHRYIIYDQERMMYRNIDTMILMDKEDHIAILDTFI